MAGPIPNANWFQNHFVPNDASKLKHVLQFASDANNECSSRLCVIPSGIAATALSAGNILAYPVRGAFRWSVRIIDGEVVNAFKDLFSDLGKALQSLVATAIIAACLFLSIFYPGIFQKLYPVIPPPPMPAAVAPEPEQKQKVDIEALQRTLEELSHSIQSQGLNTRFITTILSVPSSSNIERLQRTIDALRAQLAQKEPDQKGACEADLKAVQPLPQPQPQPTFASLDAMLKMQIASLSAQIKTLEADDITKDSDKCIRLKNELAVLQAVPPLVVNARQPLTIGGSDERRRLREELRCARQIALDHYRETAQRQAEAKRAQSEPIVEALSAFTKLAPTEHRWESFMERITPSAMPRPMNCFARNVAGLLDVRKNLRDDLFTQVNKDLAREWQVRLDDRFYDRTTGKNPAEQIFNHLVMQDSICHFRTSSPTTPALHAMEFMSTLHQGVVADVTAQLLHFFNIDKADQEKDWLFASHNIETRGYAYASTNNGLQVLQIHPFAIVDIRETVDGKPKVLARLISYTWLDISAGKSYWNFKFV